MATTTTTTEKAKPGRRTLRKLGRDKVAKKIATDKEFAAKHFESKSTRATAKKVAFRKRKLTK
jgi:hypothetical protein